MTAWDDDTNNAAGRLYVLLEAYRKAWQSGPSVLATWGDVLGISKSEVPAALAEVAGLIPALEQQIDQFGGPRHRQTFDHYRALWLRPIVPSDYNPATHHPSGANLVDPGALATLGSLADFLATVAPEGATPTPEQTQTLRAGVEEMLAEVRTAENLPVDVRRALQARLMDMLWALDHLEIGGPGAVAAAIERLIGATALYTTSQPGSGTRTWREKVYESARLWWYMFRAIPQVRDSLEGSEDILNMLGPGSDQTQGDGETPASDR